jgi:hypothetical protein
MRFVEQAGLSPRRLHLRYLESAAIPTPRPTTALMPEQSRTSCAAPHSAPPWHADSAILLLRQPDGVFHGVGGNVDPADDVVNAYLREDLRRSRRLVGFDLDFVAGDLLALVAQDADDVERAARQGQSDQFDGLGAGVAGGVVNEEMVSSTAGRYELAIIA